MQNERNAADELRLTETQIEAIGRELAEPGWLVDRRQEALKAFRNIPWPKTSDETWKRTNLANLTLADLPLEALTLTGKTKRAPAALVRSASREKICGQIVIEDGITRMLTLDEDARRAGVVLTPIGQAAKDCPDPVKEWLGRVVPPEDGKYAALASAIADTGWLIYVPKNVQLEKPVHSLIWTSGIGLRAWRLAVIVEEGAGLTVIHENASADGKGIAARVGIVELIVRRGAHLQFIETQSWAQNVQQISHEKAIIQKDGSLELGFANFGAQSSKTIARMELVEEGASGKWSGLSYLKGNQHADYETWQNHLAPRTNSDLLNKGVLADSCRSVWRGMVFVAKGAQKSDGYQVNRNLVLSEQARSDSLPALEILADDVRCSHGVSVGTIDPEEAFYLRSRGITAMETRRLLTEGFLEPVLDRISSKEIQQRIRFAVESKMGTI